MIAGFHSTRRGVRALAGVLTLAVLAATLICGSARAAVTFDGDFASGLTPWLANNGGAQCANYGQASIQQRLRGDVYVDRSGVGGVPAAGRFDLPASAPGFPWEACELTYPQPMALGSDVYYGYMFYVPAGWTSGTSTSDPNSWWGITIAQFGYQLIWGAPIEFELHDDHVTLALETGACNSYQTANPGCTWRSNADNPGGDPGNAGAYFAVPAPMRLGVWHELVMHVHWAGDSTGQIQVWHRTMGQTNWTQTADITGIPTVQWDMTTGCCASLSWDKVGAYRQFSTRPVSVWEDRMLIGTDWNSIAGGLPVSAPTSTATQPSATTQAAKPKHTKRPPHATIASSHPRAHRHHHGPRHWHRHRHRHHHRHRHTLKRPRVRGDGGVNAAGGLGHRS